VVLIGGLLSSTLLTLVFVPAMYTLFDDLQGWFVGLFHRKPKPAPAPAPPAVAPPREAVTVGDGRRG
jgi:hypothetical protein